VKGNGNRAVVEAQAKLYQAATGTCMYMMQCSYPDMFNAARGLDRHMTATREAHIRALMTLITYTVSTEDKRLVLSPNEWWSSEHKFNIHGWLDSDYATNPDDCRSISGGRVFVNGAPIVFRSVTQKFVTFSMTEAEFAAGVMVSQDMLCVNVVGVAGAQG